MAYNVLIVEDQKMPRQLLEIYIKESSNYTLISAIANANTAIKICETQKIDLILMDVLTELGVNGLEVSKNIKQEYPHIKIIIVTSMPEASWINIAREIGIDSFWYKESDGESILSIMDATMAGEHVYPETTPSVRIGKADNHQFTDRELDILRELLTGDSNSEIGKRLGISAETVKFHIQTMLKKTGFHTRTELATQARGLGIVIK